MDKVLPCQCLMHRWIQLGSGGLAVVRTAFTGLGFPTLVTLAKPMESGKEPFLKLLPCRHATAVNATLFNLSSNPTKPML